MSLFGKKKEETKAPACACSCQADDEMDVKVACECSGSATNGICSVKVLGAGCKFCHQQFENAKQAIANMGLGVEVEYVTDMEKVMAYGVMRMPALVVNEQVVSMGKVLSAGEVENLLHKLGF